MTQRMDSRGLLEGTTQEPWEAHDPVTDLIEIRGPMDGDCDGMTWPLVATVNDIGGPLGDFEANAKLLASAPTLAREHAEMQDEIASLKAEIERLREALDWYAVTSALCRKLTIDGDRGRADLADDGGKRARAALRGDGQ